MRRCVGHKIQGPTTKVKVTVMGSPLTNHLSTITQKGLSEFNQISEKGKTK